MKSLKNQITQDFISESGEVISKRYQLFSTPWFKIYLSNIRKSDEGVYFHTNPYSYKSIVLSGSLQEGITFAPFYLTIYSQIYKKFNVVSRLYQDAIKIKLLSKEAWTLDIVYNFQQDWGYATEIGYVSNKVLKNNSPIYERS